MASHKREANHTMGLLCFALSTVCSAPGYLSGLPILLIFVFELTSDNKALYELNNSITYLNVMMPEPDVK